MKKSTTVKPKRGRPATGRDPFIGIRLPPRLIDEIGTWSGKNDAASRSDAIRRLVELGLMAPANKVRPDKTMKDSDGRIIPPKPVAKPGRRARAHELAGNTIEKMIDPAVSPDERAQRRRRLTKGPPEFREGRIDLLKAKGK